MKLEIRVFAGLKCNNRELPCYGQNDFSLDVPENISVGQLYELLSLDRPETLICMVNGLAQKMDYRLSDNARVGIFPPVGGG